MLVMTTIKEKTCGLNLSVYKMEGKVFISEFIGGAPSGNFELKMTARQARAIAKGILSACDEAEMEPLHGPNQND